MADRARWSWRRGRTREVAAREGVDRRTLLMGAAATAGAVAAGASPAMASPATPAAAALTNSSQTVTAAAATGTVAASDVSVVPVGEIIDTDVQSALTTLDTRLSKVQISKTSRSR